MNRSFITSLGIVICVTGWLTLAKMQTVSAAESRSAFLAGRAMLHTKNPQAEKTKNLRDGVNYDDVKSNLTPEGGRDAKYVQVCCAETRPPMLQYHPQVTLENWQTSYDGSERSNYRGDGEIRHGVEKIVDWDYPVQQRHMWA
ncbi:MAG TPA: hypothetical protein VFE46_03145 [Pirellulales bacterium]|jgi:hypothetical protein|nr:hypothetical protein [Pirellulales bacterium]